MVDMTRDEIVAKIAELEALQKATPTWGAAVGARHEWINDLKMRLRSIEDKTIPQPAPAGVQIVWAVVRPDGVVASTGRANSARDELQPKWWAKNYPEHRIVQFALLPLDDPRLKLTIEQAEDIRNTVGQAEAIVSGASLPRLDPEAGWRVIDANTPRERYKPLDLWIVDRKTGEGRRYADASWAPHEGKDAWSDSRGQWVTGKHWFSKEENDDVFDPALTDEASRVATHWRPLPPAPETQP